MSADEKSFSRREKVAAYSPTDEGSAPHAKGQGTTLYARLKMFLELIRFSHTIFALPFALLAAAMAWWFRFNKTVTYIVCGPNGSSTGEVRLFEVGFRWQDLLGILLCMVFARSAAMAFNRVVDAPFDAENPRTVRRHIPAGLVARSTVAWWTVLCAAAFIASTLMFLPNRAPLLLSVPLLVFICGYSLTKRFTELAHFWLGASLMLAPVSAWIALLGHHAFRYPWPPLLLGGAVLFWVAGFDIIYATQDVAVDRKLKLRSIPVFLGVKGALRFAAGCHFVTVVLLFLIPMSFEGFGLIWYVGSTAVALLLIYEHRLVSEDDLTRVNAAFFTCNAIVSLGLLAVGLLDLLI